jgi:hypothetical protein
MPTVLHARRKVKYGLYQGTRARHGCTPGVEHTGRHITTSKKPKLTCPYTYGE